MPSGFTSENSKKKNFNEKPPASTICTQPLRCERLKISNWFIFELDSGLREGNAGFKVSIFPFLFSLTHVHNDVRHRSFDSAIILIYFYLFRKKLGKYNKIWPDAAGVKKKKTCQMQLNKKGHSRRSWR